MQSFNPIVLVSSVLVVVHPHPNHFSGTWNTNSWTYEPRWITDTPSKHSNKFRVVIYTLQYTVPTGANLSKLKLYLLPLLSEWPTCNVHSRWRTGIDTRVRSNSPITAHGTILQSEWCNTWLMGNTVHFLSIFFTASVPILSLRELILTISSHICILGSIFPQVVLGWSHFINTLLSTPCRKWCGGVVLGAIVWNFSDEEIYGGGEGCLYLCLCAFFSCRVVSYRIVIRISYP